MIFSIVGIIVLLTFEACYAGPPVSDDQLHPLPLELYVPVLEVLDGGTFKTVLPSGIPINVHFLVVDCPDKVNTNKPKNFMNISKLVLKEWGLYARDWLKEEIEGEWVTIRFDNISGVKGSFGRILAYAIDDGVNLNTELLRLGLARAIPKYDFWLKDQYVNLQEVAVTGRVGVWGELPAS